MEAKKGLLRIGVPTGFGPNGVRKEAVKIAKVMLAEMGSGKIEQHWGKYYHSTSKFYDGKWGVVLSVEVPDLEYTLSIMKSFEYDEVFMMEKEKRDKELIYYGRQRSKLYSYTI